MHIITRKEFLEKLETALERKITIKVLGYVDLEFIIQKFAYSIETDILKIIDNNNNNYISFNLNNVNNIAEENSKIICNLNDQIDTIIEIII